MGSAICVTGLAKKYDVEHVAGRAPYHTLRETLAGWASRPLKWWKGQGGRTTREEFWALKDVTFDVPAGQVLGVIGRNGAGKSTLLKILSRITKPTRGEARLRGRIGSLLEVGTGFHPELTGRENVFLSGVLLGLTRREVARKFDEIVAFAEVERFIDTPVKRYSSGMYVRLAFAVAAHLEPEILIVDEVLAVGDAIFQEKCLGAMQEAASSGRTILFVSHNMASIQHLCSRAMLLKGGQIAGDGSPREVVSLYFSEVGRTSSIDLRDWQDRRTNGQARIVQLDITDQAGKPTDRVPVRGEVRFTITADFLEPVPDPCFGVLIHTAAGEPLLDLRSKHDGLRLGRVRGRVKVEVALENVGLYPGDYLLSPWITDAALQVDIDWVRHCCSLRVEPAPGPHGDLQLNHAWGMYWVPSKWNAS